MFLGRRSIGGDYHAACDLPALLADPASHGGTRKERYSATKWEVAIANDHRGFVNLAMLATAAAAFHFNGHTGLLPISTRLSHAGALTEPCCRHDIWSQPGGCRSSFYGGGHAGRSGGDAGFVRFHIPLWVRRSVTMLPSFIVILMGLDPTRILVMSQVLLSFWYSAGAVPLLIFTRTKP